MTVENFMILAERLLNRRPFQVFTVVLHGGERFEVDHPGAVSVRDGLGFFIAPGKIPHWFDHNSVLQFVETGSEAKSES